MSHRADPRFLFELKRWDGKYRILFQLWQLYCCMSAFSDAIRKLSGAG